MSEPKRRASGLEELSDYLKLRVGSGPTGRDRAKISQRPGYYPASGVIDIKLDYPDESYADKMIGDQAVASEKKRIALKYPDPSQQAVEAQRQMRGMQSPPKKSPDAADGILGFLKLRKKILPEAAKR